MSESQKKTEPKKIKMPPLVDRSNAYDTLSFDNDTLYVDDSKTFGLNDENYRKNNSESISELEAM